MIDVIIAILTMVPVYLLATNGELLSQKSGVYNIGIEGVMAFGAILGISSYNFIAPNIWLSLIVGFAGGAVFGVLNSILSIHFKLDQIIVGFGLWFFGVGLAGFIHKLFLSGLPPNETFGKVLFGLDPIFYLSIVVWIALSVLFSKTNAGTKIIAVGENPRAADTAGIGVARVRWVCVTAGCGLIGLAGTYLFMNFLQGFQTGVSGYGWTAFALVMFARWKAPYTITGAIVFSAVVGLQMRLQVAGIIFIPLQFLIVLPHIAVILILTLTMAFGAKGAMPASLYVPYKRE